jgi:hypothetical protein
MDIGVIVHFQGLRHADRYMYFVSVPAPGDRVVLGDWTWYVSRVTHNPRELPNQTPTVQIDVVKYASEAGGPHG